MSVDLPAPFSPTIAWTSPEQTVRSTLLRTRWPANDFPSPLASSRTALSPSTGRGSTEWLSLVVTARDHSRFDRLLTGIRCRLERSPAASDPFVGIFRNDRGAVRKAQCLARLI